MGVLRTKSEHACRACHKYVRRPDGPAFLEAVADESQWTAMLTNCKTFDPLRGALRALIRSARRRRDSPAPGARAGAAGSLIRPAADTASQPLENPPII